MGAYPVRFTEPPLDWMQIGFVRLALPNAKIIDARRHPMARVLARKSGCGMGERWTCAMESWRLLAERR
ncbi:sulfotransferase [Sphingomonas sp.]|uniref:sulfotransferase n=1 Tax=Sphingomonas sp. TaxID=28214 RepID=UPI003FA6AEE8